MDPYGTPWMAVLDVARILVAGIGLVVGAYQVYMIRTATTPGQRARLAGIAIGILVLSASRVQNIGAPLSWQFVAAAVCIGLLAYGSWKWHDEIPSQPRNR